MLEIYEIFRKDLFKKYLYVAAGQNDNIKKAFVTKENYKKVKKIISHPDFEREPNKALTLDLKCLKYLKDYIRKLIADKKENIPMDKIEKLILFWKNVSCEKRQIILDHSEVDSLSDNDIALVELEQPFEFGKGILPSCLLENDKKKFDNSFIRKSI